MEIQGDLIILPKSNFLPLPWTVRGPLGLETGTAVSLGLVNSPMRLPDIIVTPLEIAHFHETYTLEVVLGERAGAVADFLTWFGGAVTRLAKSKINIALSETTTIEGGQRHRIHLVIEPVGGSSLSKATISAIARLLKKEHAVDIKSFEKKNTYNETPLSYDLQESLTVKNGWLHYSDWMDEIVSHSQYKDRIKHFDLSRIVVSCSPEQRLLRYIIPRKNVLELRAQHKNTPFAMEKITDAISRAKFNILSSRLSRTPGRRDMAPDKSVIVAACEPVDDETSRATLRNCLRDIPNNYQVNHVKIEEGTPAESTIYLIPKASEQIIIDPDLRVLRDKVRQDVAEEFMQRHGTKPTRFIFLSRRFLNPETADEKAIAEEQARTVKAIIECLERYGMAVIQAKEPEQSSWKIYDEHVHKAVFSRLWASDACVVLALDSDGSGTISSSMGHEIGFFGGRARPFVVLASRSRNPQAQFGNIIGTNRIPYADYPNCLVGDDAGAICTLLSLWLASLTPRS